VGEGSGLLLRWEGLVAFKPRVSGLDGVLRFLSASREPHEGAARDHLLGVGLGDVDVELGVS
jgi:hypothetical protein